MTFKVVCKHFHLLVVYFPGSGSIRCAFCLLEPAETGGNLEESWETRDRERERERERERANTQTPNRRPGIPGESPGRSCRLGMLNVANRDNATERVRANNPLRSAACTLP